MTAAIIGLSSGLFFIFLFNFFKHLDQRLIYGLILTGIGFLYVGFVWTDKDSVVINSIQAVVFLLIAYAGVKRNLYFLVAGFLLHGLWDIIYPFFRDPSLIPPHYDLFCLTIDVVMGLYILVFKKQFTPRA